MKAYKVFNSDLTCRNFQYEIGKTFKHEGKIQLCESGFHACLKIVDCFNYYSFDPNNRVCEVELSGEIIKGEDKSVCSEITLIKELTWSDILSLVNTGNDNSGYGNSGNLNSGNRNSGHCNSGNKNSEHYNSGNNNSGNLNSGYRNSGNSNSGNWNSGNLNSGNRNSGDWNSCNMENGYFNSKKSYIIRVFNKKCTSEIWAKSEKPSFIYNIILNKWISFDDMTDDEKKSFPNASICNGYLKTYSYKEAWRNAYNNASEHDIELLKKLPNFNADVFEKITGIRID